jgi:hypothetical protein
MTQIEFMYVAFITNLQVNDPQNMSIARVLTNCLTLFSFLILLRYIIWL